MAVDWHSTESGPDQAAQDVQTNDVDDKAPGTIDKALLAGSPQKVGRFEYRYDTGIWTWSDTVARMHGYQPGDVVPTTDLVLSHKHPDDLAQVRALLGQSSAPFSSRHRIRTTTGETRSVVVVGDAEVDDVGSVVATHGFYIDITDSVDALLQEAISARVGAIVANRETIDLAKGMLMVVYGIDSAAAFQIIRWRSQELNVKVVSLAEKIVNHLPRLVEFGPEGTQPVDHYLMTFTFND